MAIAHRPKLLIADEPTTALDAALRADIMRSLRRLCERARAWQCCSSAMIWRRSPITRIMPSCWQAGRIEEQRTGGRTAPASCKRLFPGADRRQPTPSPIPHRPLASSARHCSTRAACRFPSRHQGWRGGRVAAVDQAGTHG